jgi:hypothetical protein
MFDQLRFARHPGTTATLQSGPHHWLPNNHPDTQHLEARGLDRRQKTRPSGVTGLIREKL